MSTVYWSSPSRTAELRGSERAHLARLAQGPADAAWELGGDALRDVVLARIRSVVEVAEPTYINELLAKAESPECTRTDTARAAYGGLLLGMRTLLHVEGLRLTIGGIPLQTMDLDANTALAAGSDVIRLAAKLHHQCEAHCWVDGPDRAWLAEIIRTGLDIGVYRAGIWCQDTPGGPRDRWVSQGWDDVLALLEERDDEPVVLSYSVTEDWPDPEFGWMPPWPEGVPERWNALSETDQKTRSDRREAWSELTETEQWAVAMPALRDRPWGRLAPDTLAAETFGLPVTVYDLWAPDRDARVRRAAPGVSLS